MKTVVKVFAVIAAALFAAATIIKFTQRTSYKEAVGIMEELWKEIRDRCALSCRSTDEDEA